MNQGHIVVMQNGEMVPNWRVAEAREEDEGWHEHYLGGALSAAFLFN